MESGSYYGSRNRERVSEWQRRLAVNQFGRTPIAGSSPAAPTKRKSAGGNHLPSTPNGMGTGLLSRPELVRVRPTAPLDLGRGQKL